jgi:hypothetical protein
MGPHDKTSQQIGVMKAIIASLEIAVTRESVRFIGLSRT